MLGLNFNPFTSKTVLAGIMAVITVFGNALITSGHISAVDIGAAITALLTAVGIRDAIAKHGTTPADDTPAKPEGYLGNAGFVRVGVMATVAASGAVTLFASACSGSPVTPNDGGKPSRPFFATPFAIKLSGNTVSGSLVCDADEPTVGCTVAVSGQIGSTPINFSPVADAAIGATVNISAPIVCTPLANVSVTVTVRGKNRSGEFSDPVSQTATAKCPDGKPGAPRFTSFTITVNAAP